MIHFDMPREKSNIIKVLGFGGGGGNAVNHMYRQQIQNVDFIICNTDSQALQNSDIPNKIQLGPHLTQGLGAGADPKIGKQATEESLEELRRILEINTKMAFITAGMGGGTGTGGAPTVARICRELGILTVGIVTTPFVFEGPRRMKQAREGIDELKEHVDTLLVISNEKLRNQFGALKMREAFGKADNVLTTAARCITDVINSTGQINVDFADVCTVMRNGGVAILGSAQESGENRAQRAIEAAINSPLLNDNDIRGAKWILLNICSAEGEHEYTMDEVEIIQNYVREQSGEDTDVILGMGYDEDLGDNLGITIIATGFDHKDPFVKTAAPRQVVTQPLVEEPPIIMTLGVEGEEKKMEDPQPVAAMQEAPIVVNAEQIVMPSSMVVTDADEVLVANDVAEAVTSETEEQVFELSIEQPEPLVFSFDVTEEEIPQQEEVTLETTVTAPEPIVDTTIEDEALQFELSLDVSQVEQEAAVDSLQDEEVPAFLQKPQSIYFEAEPEQEVTLHVEEEPVEEAVQPVAEIVVTEAIHEELKPVMHEETDEEQMAVAGMTLTVEEPVEPVAKAIGTQLTAGFEDLSEDEEQKRRAKERINRLRNLSFNPQHTDNGEFDQVPAYLRRDMELHNSIANVEDFYSRAQVKTDDNNNTTISTLNNFLHGEKPD